MRNKWLLVVTGKDRPGIIADVTGVLYRAHANLEDMSMTILEGAFAMIVVVTVNPQKKSSVERALLRLRGLSFDWKKWNGSLKKGKSSGGNLYLVSAMGKDRTGIVYEISRELSKRRLNIQDLNSRVLGKDANAVYAMVLEVMLPKSYAIAPLKRALAKIGAQLKVEVTLKPVEQLQF